ncbi:MAG: hypothetical protein HY063_04900 [Bacteroidetes bacterium]|nr:hypothetical protein [Bacteroidota bacterium]
MKRVKVSLELARKSVLELISFGYHVVSEMTGNAFFASPHPALSTIASVTSQLQTAYGNAQGAGPHETAVMNQKREICEAYLTELGHYVEDVANDPSNVLTGAETIILSAGMGKKQFSPRQKQEFGVQAGELPGTADLTAAHVKRGSHEWGYTQDLSNPNGWIDGGTTVQAHTTISGLETGKRYFFRHRSILPEGPSAWEGPAELVVQ